MGLMDRAERGGKMCKYGACRVCGIWGWLPEEGGYDGRCVTCGIHDLKEGDVPYQVEGKGILVGGLEDGMRSFEEDDGEMD